MKSFYPEQLEPAQETSETAFVPYGQRLRMSMGANWISSAWQLVKQKLNMWWLFVFLLTLGSLILSVLVRYVPFFDFIQFFLTPIFMGGLMLVCDHQYRHGELKMGLLFVPFKTHLWPLLGVGLASMVWLMISVFGLFFLLGVMWDVNFIGAIFYGEDLTAFTEQLNSQGTASFFVAFALSILVIVLFNYALIWFAPTLIVLHNVPVLSALKMSLCAVKKNLLPGFLYVVLIFVAVFVFSIVAGVLTAIYEPLVLGILVVAFLFTPVLLAIVYTSYRSIFLRSSEVSSMDV